MSEKKIIIAIDGYSSCGKSTLAKALAQKLHYNFIDSGSMYRAITWYLIENKISLEKLKSLSHDDLESLLDKINITFQADGSVIDGAGLPVNRAMVIYNKSAAQGTSSAISVIGASGRVKVWRYSLGGNKYIE